MDRGAAGFRFFRYRHGPAIATRAGDAGVRPRGRLGGGTGGFFFFFSFFSEFKDVSVLIGGEQMGSVRKTWPFFKGSLPGRSEISAAARPGPPRKQTPGHRGSRPRIGSLRPPAAYSRSAHNCRTSHFPFNLLTSLHSWVEIEVPPLPPLFGIGLYSPFKLSALRRNIGPCLGPFRCFFRKRCLFNRSRSPHDTLRALVGKRFQPMTTASRRKLVARRQGLCGQAFRLHSAKIKSSKAFSPLSAPIFIISISFPSALAAITS